MRRALPALAILTATLGAAHAADPVLPRAAYALPPERGGEPAFLQEARGRFYLGTLTGANLIGATRSRFDVPAGNLVVRTEYEIAAYAAGRLGYGFDPMFGAIHPRIEAEVGYASNAVDRYRVGGMASARADSFGEARTFQAYANAMFDMDVGLPVRPYIGGGVGVADVRLRRQGVSATGVVVDSSDAAFAYHLDAGVGMDLSSLGSSPLLKGTTVELGYRWTHAPDLRFTDRAGSAFKSEYQSNMVTFGTRKSF